MAGPPPGQSPYRHPEGQRPEGSSYSSTKNGDAGTTAGMTIQSSVCRLFGLI